MSSCRLYYPMMKINHDKLLKGPRLGDVHKQVFVTLNIKLTFRGRGSLAYDVMIVANCSSIILLWRVWVGAKNMLVGKMLPIVMPTTWLNQYQEWTQ